MLNPAFPDFPAEMDAVRAIMRESVASGCDLLREVADFMALGGGKLLRPRLLLLSGRSFAAVDEGFLRVAAAI